MAVTEIKSTDDFNALTEKCGSGLLVVHFWAPWATQCEVMNTAMIELAKANLQVNFAKVEAESVPEVSLKCEITAVPTCVLLKNKQVIDRVNGANGAELAKKVTHHADANASPAPPPKEDLNTKLKRLINTAPCMLFMKGNPDQPKCGFSRTTIELLNRNNIQYKTFDILEDDDVRQGLKTYSNWPTFPQLYLNGELVGGLDILKEMEENGDMKEGFPVKEKLDDKLKRLINTAPCMLFMKGNPDQPRCGFSRTTIELLNRNSIQYKTFDILEDNDVRQGLKTYSNWPTFPQLYLNGELVGGLDILKEMEENGDMKEGFPVKEKLDDKLKRLIKSAPCMLFMKGNPDQPRCGFSRTTIELLNKNSIQYKTFDILEDNDVRQGLKTFSNWPTYPQLYLNGDLVGGLDILKEMEENGDLKEGFPKSS